MKNKSTRIKNEAKSILYTKEGEKGKEKARKRGKEEASEKKQRKRTAQESKTTAKAFSTLKGLYFSSFGCTYGFVLFALSFL